MRSLAIGIVSAGLVAGPGQAQDLRRRLESGPDGLVAVSFAARPDVCGSGTSFLRIGPAGFGDGTWLWSRNDGPIGASCEAGPVRALLSRVDGRVTSVRLGIGQVRWPAATTDLGIVPASGAASYFAELATRADGRLGRDALTAAVMADSADLWRGLLAIVRNPAISRGLRESAASWLGREASAVEPQAARPLAAELIALATDPDLPSSARTRAVAALGRTDGSGVPDLLTLLRSDEPAIAKAAVTALGRVSDSRARDALRRAARDSSSAVAVRLEAIRALGGRDATPADLATLRQLWPTLASVELKGAMLDLMADAGGGETTRWLLGIAGQGSEPSHLRAQAVRAAEQSGAGSAQLIRLYDDAGDRRVREAVLDALLKIGDRAAREKVTHVAQNDTDPELRRAALTRLAKNADRATLSLLQAVAEK